MILNQHLFFYKILPKSLKEHSKVYDKINEKFFLSQNFVYLPDKIDVLYIGDSHVEFYSRSKNFKNDYSFSNRKAIWLGPKTIIGIKFENLADEIIKIINRTIEGKPNKQFYLLFSLGSIDVRCSIYEFFIRKIISDDNQLNILIKESIEYLYEKIFKILLQNPKIINIGFF